MRSAALAAAIALAACQSQPMAWYPTAWTHVSADEAAAQCQYQASMVSQQPQNAGILMPAAAYNHAFGLCMNANGWVLGAAPASAGPPTPPPDKYTKDERVRPLGCNFGGKVTKLSKATCLENGGTVVE